MRRYRHRSQEISRTGILPDRWQRTASYFQKLLLCSCIFLLPLLLSVPAFADGVEVDQKLKKGQASGNPSVSSPQLGKGAPSNAVEPATAGEKGPVLSEFDLARYQYCGEDSDCVVELNGCCQCETGAQEVAVNKNRVEAFRSQFTGCAEVSCGAIADSEHCGGGVVSCIEHRCRFFPADEGI